MIKNKIEKNSEMQALKRIEDLLILISVKLGASNSEVAKVLSCGESTLRKKFSFSGNKNGKNTKK